MNQVTETSANIANSLFFHITLFDLNFLMVIIKIKSDELSARYLSKFEHDMKIYNNHTNHGIVFRFIIRNI